MNESLSGGSNAARLNTQNTDSIPAPSTPPTLATSSLPPSGLPDARIPDSSRQVAADTKTSESISIAPRTPPALEALLQNSQALQNGSNLHERRLSRNLGLQVQTDLQTPPRPALTLSALEGALPSQDTAIEPPSADHLSPLPAGGSSLPSMSSYFNALHASHSFDNASSYSPASALPSPALSAMIDITPLPSPIYPGSGTPKRSLSNARSRRSSLGIRPLQDGVSRSNSVNSQCTSPRKKKHYGGLLPASMGGHAPHMAMAMATSGDQSHGRSRSVSDFVPETLQNVRQRVVTLGATPMSLDERVDGGHLHREEYVAAKRGLVERHVEIKHLPSPPPSNRSTVDSEMEDDDDEAPDQPGVEYFRAVVGPDRRKRKWRSLKLIGKGTFSKVYLATSQHILPGATTDEQLLNPTKLVAVKICEHGPAGGADEQRIKHSLDREISILKSVSHPSIVRLKAMSEAPGRTELIMSFCKGGDLFEFASERRDLLRIELIQRMFAELVAATAYLHQNLIVHRDIKLESMFYPCPPTIAFTAPHSMTDFTFYRRPCQCPRRSSHRHRHPDTINPPFPNSHPHRPRSVEAHRPAPGFSPPHNPLRQRGLRRPGATPRPTLRRPQHRRLGSRCVTLRPPRGTLTVRRATRQTGPVEEHPPHRAVRLDLVAFRGSARGLGSGQGDRVGGTEEGGRGLP